MRVAGDALVLHALRWPDEIRSPSGAAPPAEAELSEDELAEAERLIDTLSNVDIDTIRDSYRDALEDVLVAKSEGRQFEHGAEKPAVVVDLMAALQESVRSAQAQRGEALGDEARVHPRKPPAAKKTQAGKKTARKTASGKKPRPSA